MSDPSDNPLKRLIDEIHRRSLWQVMGIYVVASWGVLSVVDTLGGALNLPDWFPSFALALLVIGLPVVLATAFVQEGGPGHHVDEPDAAVSDQVAAPQTEPTVPSRLFTWKNAILGGAAAFVLLIGVGLGWVMFGDRTMGESGSAGAPASIEQSIAVLPFDDLSPEGD